jgi:hypothetical protein
VLEADGAIFAVLSLCEMFERSIVENVAVLKNLDERNAFVMGSLREHAVQMLHVDVN